MNNSHHKLTRAALYPVLPDDPLPDASECFETSLLKHASSTTEATASTALSFQQQQQGSSDPLLGSLHHEDSNNDGIVAEQLAILRQIEEENRRKVQRKEEETQHDELKGLRSLQRSLSSSASSVSTSPLYLRDHQTEQIDSNVEKSQPSSVPSTRPSSPIPHQTSSSLDRQQSWHPETQPRRCSSSDRVGRTRGGKKVRIRGTQHAVRAIVEGSATLFQCPKCASLLQVPQKSKNIFCTICRKVSPACANAAALSINQDEAIAQALQRQEHELADQQAVASPRS